VTVQQEQTKTVYIRADGSKDIGMGHLNRASIISRYLKEQNGWDVKLIHKKDELAEAFLRSKNISSIHLNAQTFEEEIAELNKIAAAADQPLLFILDVLEYDIRPEYIACIRSFNAPIFAITDDSFQRLIDVDLVLNGNPNQLGLSYPQTTTKYLLGPMYFIMDPGYASQRIAPPAKEVKSILISLGGSDHNNYLFKILDALQELKGVRFNIISSFGTGYTDKLKNYISTYPLPSEIKFDIPSLKDEWKTCDMSITAAGNTLFERIATGLPGLTICQLTRQNELADKFEEFGVNTNLGLGSELDFSTLKNKVESFILNTPLRISQYERSPEYVDGKGLQKLNNELKILLQ
jgi:UDP-2,4-diacetamido-2,4,6-trideoxy-beta-L-altropyranose hydrolase